jgi:type IV fimbrial biogenesis protein FimT
MAIVTSFAAPSMSEFFARWQISNTLNTYTSSLQLARSEAVKRGRIVRMCRSSNGTTCTAASEGLVGWKIGWIVYVDNDASGTTFTTGDEILFVQSGIENFDSILSNNSSTIAFSPFGTLVKGVGAQGLTFNKDDTRSRGLCISFSGRYYFVDNTANCNS